MSKNFTYIYLLSHLNSSGYKEVKKKRFVRNSKSPKYTLSAM